MKLQQWLLSVLFAMSLSQNAVAIDTAEDYDRSRFESRMGDSAAVVSYYYDRALILQHGTNSFQAVFMTVEDQKTQEICGFGVSFRDEYGIGIASYKLPAQYYCDEQFKPYLGAFRLKPKECTAFCPPTPAAGVGNLSIKPLEAKELISLPVILKVVIQGLPAQS